MIQIDPETTRGPGLGRPRRAPIGTQGDQKSAARRIFVDPSRAPLPTRDQKGPKSPKTPIFTGIISPVLEMIRPRKNEPFLARFF